MSEESIVSGLCLVHGAVKKHVVACLLNSLLNRNLLFSRKNSNVNNVENQKNNHWKENFGKSAQLLSHSKKGSEV